MDHLSREELEQRTKDIMINQLVLTEEAKIGPVKFEQGGDRWWELFTHTLEEWQLRCGPYPAGFDSGFMRDLKGIPNPRNPFADKAAKAVKDSNFKIGNGLIKFGKYQHIKKSFKNGIFRISPAKSYSDPSLNPAIKDDELKLSINPHPSEYKMEVFDGDTNKLKGIIRPIGSKITTKSLTNYYVFCLSFVLTPRLFLDFEADSCLVIHKPVVFINRLLAAVKRKLPTWVDASGKVLYVDPLKPPSFSLTLSFSKHFRYSYQEEFRLVWYPPKNINDLPDIEVEIGDLKDCCNLLYINEDSVK